MDIAIFQWCAAALVGFSLMVPFMSHKMPQRQLLVILPHLYNELDTYPHSFVVFDRSPLVSMEKYWLPPFDKDVSPYGVDILTKL